MGTVYPAAWAGTLGRSEGVPLLGAPSPRFGSKHGRHEASNKVTHCAEEKGEWVKGEEGGRVTCDMRSSKLERLSRWGGPSYRLPRVRFPVLWCVPTPSLSAYLQSAFRVSGRG